MFKLLLASISLFIASCSYKPDICNQNSVIGSFVEKKVTLEVACSDAQRGKGLMNRQWLAENDGMIFIFPNEEYLSFWMKNTLIPLSIAFVDKDMTIVDIREMQALNLEPVKSSKKAMMAIEMNTQWFSRNNIKTGDKLKIN